MARGGASGLKIARSQVEERKEGEPPPVAERAARPRALVALSQNGYSRSLSLSLSSSPGHEGCLKPLGREGPPDVFGGFGGA